MVIMLIIVIHAKNVLAIVSNVQKINVHNVYLDIILMVQLLVNNVLNLVYFVIQQLNVLIVLMDSLLMVVNNVTHVQLQVV